MRPIDADALGKSIEMTADSLKVSWIMDRHEMFAMKIAYSKAASMVRMAPTLDYAPVRHGEWVEGLKCSECGNVDWTKPNYCPNCGSKMDGGK